MVQRRKILVIDDDQSVCDTFARTLSDRGYEVYTETRYPEGVNMAEEVLPDLVFVSLLLDTTNGLKVSKEIHAIDKLRKVPIVMLISYKGELDPKYTVTIGVVDVLVKPPRENDIILKTEAILGSYAGLNKEDQSFSGVPDEEDFGAIAGRSEDREQAKEYVPGSAVETDKKGLEFDDRYHEIPEMPDEEVNQHEEYISQAGDALKKGRGISGEERDESSFGEADEEAEESTYFGETDLESLDEEDRDTDDSFEMQGEEEVYPAGKDEKNGNKRKILMLAAALALVAVIGIGTYMGLQFLFGGKDRTVVQTSRSDAPVLPKKKAESLPGAQTKKGRAEVPEHSPAVKETEETSAVRNKETFSAQVGFFGNLKNAEVLAEKMKRQGYKAFIKKEEKAAGKISYRVLVGKFRSRNEALEQSKVILQKEGIKPVLYKESGTPS
jgi:DNA-binding response OmpR family regulator/cell division septation protein DedD